MATFILTWNGSDEAYDPDDYVWDVEATKEGASGRPDGASEVGVKALQQAIVFSCSANVVTAALLPAAICRTA